MAISYSISNTINYDPVGIGIEDPLTEFPTIYGNVNFGYTVTFTETTGYEIANTIIVSSPEYTNEELVILTNNSIRITKDTNQSIYPNEYYSFAEFDTNFSKTIVVLQSDEIDQANSNSSVFNWNVPSQQVVNGSYTFEITFINTGVVPNITETVTQTYTQDLVWSLIPGTQALLELVSRSKY